MEERDRQPPGKPFSSFLKLLRLGKPAKGIFAAGILFSLIEAASGLVVPLLTKQLVDRYVEALLAAADNQERFAALRAKVETLVAAHPAAQSAELEIVLLQAEYQQAETAILAWQENPADADSLEAARSTLSRVQPLLAAHQETLAAAADQTAEAIDSDVTSLERLLLLSRLAPRDLDLAPLFAELRRLLRNEADYTRERSYTEEYARRLAGDARFSVPRIYPEYCTSRVLAMSYEEGLGVLDPQVQALPLARRNRLAEALVGLFLDEFFGWGMVQTDPNFGNFRFRIGGRTPNHAEDAEVGDPAQGIRSPSPNSDRIVLLDFGAVRRFSPHFVDGYRDIVAGALTRDRPRVVRGATDLKMLRLDLPPAVHDSYARACEIIVEPFNDHARDGTPATCTWQIMSRLSRIVRTTSPFMICTW